MALLFLAASKLGAANYGAFATWIQAALVFTAFADFNLGSLLTRNLAGKKLAGWYSWALNGGINPLEAEGDSAPPDLQSTSFHPPDSGSM